MVRAIPMRPVNLVARARSRVRHKRKCERTNEGPPVGGPSASCALGRLEANQPGQEGIEALAVAGMEVDAADLLDQPLQRLQLLEPQQQGVLLHQAGGVQQRARCRSLLLTAD